MSVRYLLPLALLATVLTAPLNAEEGKFVSLFDGKSLDGWEGKDFWSVKDGAITGQTTKEKPTKGNTFLIWKGGEIDDFELHLKFRIVGGNSGIQYRSKHVGNYVVSGYQADIDTSGKYIGILYSEKTGRGILAQRGKKVVIDEEGNKKNAGETCDNKKFLEALKKEDWNDYVIKAKGNRLVQEINGFVTVDVTDNHATKGAKSGILALQLHAGPAMLVQFKDIKLKKLK